MDDSNGNGRNFGKEIDGLKDGMTELKEMLQQMLNQSQSQAQSQPVENDERGNGNREETESNKDDGQDWAAYDKQWKEFGEQWKDFGKQFADKEKVKKGYSFSYSSDSTPRPPRPPRPPRHPRPPRPPRPPQSPRSKVLFGVDIGRLSDTVQRTLNQSLQAVEESLKDLNVELDMVDLSFKPMLESIKQKLEDRTTRGIVTYAGGYRPNDDTTVYWSAKERTFDDILESLGSSDAEKVLAAIGSRQKLDILLALLHAPMTVNDLVAYIGFNTTGQVYHHIHQLLATKVVVEQEGAKGYYTINPSMTPGILMILTGVRDILSADGADSVDWNADTPDDQNQ